jgi:hypothetical protein
LLNKNPTIASAIVGFSKFFDPDLELTLHVAVGANVAHPNGQMSRSGATAFAQIY